MENYTWGNVTLNEYAEFERVRKIECVHQIDILERDAKLISILTGRFQKDIECLPMATFNEMRDEMYKFTSVSFGGKFKNTFRVGLRKFRFNPTSKSIKVSDLADLSLLHITDDNIADKLPTILAIFCHEVRIVPFRSKLEFEDKVKLFGEKLKADIGMGIALFFCKVSEELLPIIQESLEEKMKEMMKIATEELAKIRED